MICGWFAPEQGAGGAAIVDAMAHAVRVREAERWVIHETPGGLAIAVTRTDGGDDDPARDDPAVSANRRFWLWMAGEAYDGGSLCPVPTAAFSRTRQFRRTLLEAVLAQGIDAIASLDGRYQIVVFDALERVVTMATDRFGALPIFWAHSAGGTAFAGGVRGVLMAPGVDARPDTDAIEEAVTFGGFRLGGRTNVRGVQRLRGGAILRIAGSVSTRDYWTWPGAPPDHDRPIDELVDEAHRLWQRAIAVRLDDARRPGQTLSGGLDSRAILAEAAGAASSWTSLTYGVEGCDDARYAERAAAAAGATWVFDPLYQGSAPDWLERRTAFIQETDGLMQLSDLLHCESLHLQPGLFDVHLSGYLGDVVCGTTYDSVVDAPTLLEKMPYTGVPIGWSYQRALEWGGAAIGAVAPAQAKFAIYEHKFPQAIHPIFQTYAPYVRLCTPFTDYALFDFFAVRSPRSRERLYRSWLARKYPWLFRWIPDQRTGLPVTAPDAAVTLERYRRGGLRMLSNALHTAKIPFGRPRARAYHDEHRRWTMPAIRERIERVVLRDGSVSADVFGRDALQAVLGDWFDGANGPVQVVGALYTFEAYHRDLPAHLRAAALASAHSGPRVSVLA
jgi:asparagine synthase (glutamine-hydrolysing)